MSDSEALAPRLSVSEIVSVYEREEANIRQAFAALARSEKALTDTFALGEWRGIRIQDNYRHSIDFEDVESCLTQLRRQIWRTLVERLELRRMMSIKAWDELEKKIDQGEVPEINQQTVAAMARQFEQALPEMLEAAVDEVFNFLRPHHDNFKTNSQFEIGPKVILSGYVHIKWSGSGFEPEYYCEQKLTALENVFTALDGKGSITKGHYSELSQAIRACHGGRGETAYFRFKCFRKRTLHIEFLRPDLVKRLNQIAGGMRLRGERKAA